MTPDEARQALSLHSGRNERIDDSRYSDGFVCSFRPYRGALPEAAFHDVMAALKVLAADFGEDPVNRDLIADVFSILFFPRHWSSSPGAMLVRNGLLGEADQERLVVWLEIIGETVMFLIEGAPEEAFRSYEMYCEGRRAASTGSADGCGE